MQIPKYLNFLVVGDLVSDSFLLQRQLKKLSSDPEVRFVDSKLSLINALKTYIPDFVLTDFNLIGMDAFDVIKIVKEYNSKIPVIVISGHLKNEENETQLIEAGAEGFFLKDPINNLNERLSTLLTSLLLEKKDLLEKIARERQKHEHTASEKDFLREFSEKEKKESNFFDSLVNLFSRNSK